MPQAGKAGIIVDVAEEQAEAMFDAAQEAFSGPQMGMFLKQVMEPWVQRRARHRFQGEGDDVTGPWAPLQPATEDIRESMGFPPSHPINVRTGELYQHITGSEGYVAAGLNHAELVYPNNSPSGGDLADKMRVAQTGNYRDPRTPKRPVLGLGVIDMEFMLVQLSQWFTRQVRRRGL